MYFTQPETKKYLLVTGGAGFIGSHFLDEIVDSPYNIIVLDSLTYAGKRENLEAHISSKKVNFIHGSIEDFIKVKSIFENYDLAGIVNFAAETHVDRSIEGPSAFIQTNILGVYNLLEISRNYLKENKDFKFVQVSTDEVYGQLGDTGFFNENSSYQPNSPYAASKASADMLCRAWFHTYHFPVIVTNCSNNYGPRQFPEKLVPVIISKCVNEEPLPIYGKGFNIRDWIYVKDHCRGVRLAFEKGIVGETYCFGGNAERKNIDLVNTICGIMDEVKPRARNKLYCELISYVTDRAGHDFRYAIDDRKAQKQLGFSRQVSFDQGLKETILWYLNNPSFLLERNKK